MRCSSRHKTCSAVRRVKWCAIESGQWLSVPPSMQCYTRARGGGVAGILIGTSPGKLLSNRSMEAIFNRQRWGLSISLHLASPSQFIQYTFTNGAAMAQQHRSGPPEADGAGQRLQAPIRAARVEEPHQAGSFARRQRGGKTTGLPAFKCFKAVGCCRAGS